MAALVQGLYDARLEQKGAHDAVREVLQSLREQEERAHAQSGNQWALPALAGRELRTPVVAFVRYITQMVRRDNLSIGIMQQLDIFNAHPRSSLSQSNMASHIFAAVILALKFDDATVLWSSNGLQESMLAQWKRLRETPQFEAVLQPFTVDFPDLHAEVCSREIEQFMTHRALPAVGTWLSMFFQRSSVLSEVLGDLTQAQEARIMQQCWQMLPWVIIVRPSGAAFTARQTAEALIAVSAAVFTPDAPPGHVDRWLAVFDTTVQELRAACWTVAQVVWGFGYGEPQQGIPAALQSPAPQQGSGAAAPEQAAPAAATAPPQAPYQSAPVHTEHVVRENLERDAGGAVCDTVHREEAMRAPLTEEDATQAPTSRVTHSQEAQRSAAVDGPTLPVGTVRRPATSQEQAEEESDLTPSKTSWELLSAGDQVLSWESEPEMGGPPAVSGCDQGPRGGCASGSLGPTPGTVPAACTWS